MLLTTTKKKKTSPCSLCANARKAAARKGRSVWYECQLPSERFNSCVLSGCTACFRKRATTNPKNI